MRDLTGCLILFLRSKLLLYSYVFVVNQNKQWYWSFGDVELVVFSSGFVLLSGFLRPNVFLYV